MNTKMVRELMIEPLRSGEFEQGYEWLSVGDKKCCLGVATEMARRKGFVEGEWVARSDEPGAIRGFRYQGGRGELYTESLSLPTPVMELLGFDSLEGPATPKPDYIGDDEHWPTGAYYLSTVNDRKFSFAVIADSLEIAVVGEERRALLAQHPTD